MATIATTSHGSFTNAPRRSYIAMADYTSDLFGYSLTFNPATFTNVGVLSNLGIPATSTLQGSILSETGKKLYPVVNAGVSTLMVSVYDQTSKVTGFINPNSPIFAIFNTDKPPYMGQGVDPGTSGLSNLGNSIYTHGSVIADGSLTIGTTAQVGGSISSGTVVIAPSTYTQHLFLTPVGVGNAVGNASIGSNAMTSGTPSYAGVSTSACRTTSKVFLTNISGLNVIRVGAVNNGSFSTLSGNSVTDVFNWLIIN